MALFDIRNETMNTLVKKLKQEQDNFVKEKIKKYLMPFDRLVWYICDFLNFKQFSDRYFHQKIYCCFQRKLFRFLLSVPPSLLVDNKKFLCYF